MTITSLVRNQNTLLIIPRGPRGPAGAQGPAGSGGLGGRSGGIIVFPGADDGDFAMPVPGRRGATGATGATGAAGAPGAAGATGPTGPQGPRGLMGFRGFDGDDGEPGMPIPGRRGATGATGATGPQGPQGPQGPSGGGTTIRTIIARGFDGEDGEPGMTIPGKKGASGGGASNYVGASSGAAGTAGLVPPASAGQQNYIMKGDATWAQSGSFLEKVSFRDPSISGFTGAKFEMVQFSGQTTDDSTITLGNIPIANGESMIVRVNIHAFQDTLGAAYALEQMALFRRSASGSMVRSGNIYGTSFSAKDASVSAIAAVSNAAGGLDIQFTGEVSKTFNIFATAMVWRLKTNS